MGTTHDSQCEVPGDPSMVFDRTSLRVKGQASIAALGVRQCGPEAKYAHNGPHRRCTHRQGTHRHGNVSASGYVETNRERHAADVDIHASSPTVCESHTQMFGFAAHGLWYNDPDSWFHGSGGIAASIEAAVLAAMSNVQPDEGGEQQVGLIAPPPGL